MNRHRRWQSLTGARTFLSAATWSRTRVGEILRASERSGVAADKNVRQECPRAGSLTQAADFADGGDKSNHSKNQEPRMAFDGQQNSQSQHRTHSQPNSNRIKKFH